MDTKKYAGTKVAVEGADDLELSGKVQYLSQSMFNELLPGDVVEYDGSKFDWWTGDMLVVEPDSEYYEE